MTRGWRLADALSLTRVLLIPVISYAALRGEGRLVGLGLVIAGMTDFLDGYLARRMGQASARGAQIDSLADILLLFSAAVWIELLHPEILRENAALLAATFGLYVATLVVGFIKFHELRNLRLYSPKAAGGLLYSFAVITLVAGGYEPLLLWLYAAAFMVSSVETLLAQLLFSAVDETMGSILLPTEGARIPGPSSPSAAPGSSAPRLPSRRTWWGAAPGPLATSRPPPRQTRTKFVHEGPTLFAASVTTRRQAAPRPA